MVLRVWAVRIYLVGAVLALVVLLVSCVSGDRFDTRPDMCKDLNKRGEEC